MQNNEYVIRNNKYNIMFKPGYALENGVLMYSSSYIDDINTTKEEQNLDVETKEYNVKLRQYALKQLENKFNAQPKVADFYKLTSPKNKNAVENKIILWGISSVAGIIATILLVKETFILAPIVTASLSIAALFRMTYKLDERLKIKKTEDQALKNFEEFQKNLKEILEKEKQQEYEREKEKIDIETELERNMVIKQLSNKPLDDIYDKLSKPLQEKLDQQRGNQYTKSKSLNNGKDAIK